MARHDPHGPTRTTDFDVGDERPTTRAEVDPLSNPRRRRILRYLRERGRPATIDDVAAALPADDDRVARIRLHHADLPKLADTGVLEYDPDGGRVRLTDAE